MNNSMTFWIILDFGEIILVCLSPKRGPLDPSLSYGRERDQQDPQDNSNKKEIRLTSEEMSTISPAATTGPVLQ